MARGVRQGNSHLRGFGATAKGVVGGVVGVFAAVKAVDLVKGFVTAASDAQQSVGATESIYGKYADAVIAKSKKASTEVGLSANAYRELSNVLGAGLKNSGTPLDKLGGKTSKLISLGGDLAATFGGTTKDAVEAISSLMRGEADPIERYGVSIKQSDVNSRLAAKGLKGLTGQKLKDAEATARLELLYKQTKGAQGQFGRESNTLAGQTQRLGAMWDNAKAALGARLLPVLTKAAETIGSKLPAAFAGVQTALDKVSPAFQTLGDVARPVFDFINNNREVVGVFVGVLGAAAVATGIWAAATGVLNAVLLLNPVTLVVVAIAALAAGVVYAYKRSETFRAVVQAAFAAVKIAAAAVRDAFGFIWNAAQRMATLVGDSVGKVKTTVGNLKSTVTGALSGAADWLLDTGKNIMKGLLAGIDKGLGWVRDKLSGVGRFIPGWLKKVLGINSPARELIPVGRFSMLGIARGFDLERRSIVAGLDATARTIATYTMPTPRYNAATAASTFALDATPYRGGKVTQHITVKIDASMTEEEMGRSYKRAIKAAERVGIA